MEGSKVSEARRIPAFFDELYRIQDQNHGYGEDGEDGYYDEEFDEGEARSSGARFALRNRATLIANFTLVGSPDLCRGGREGGFGNHVFLLYA